MIYSLVIIAAIATGVYWFKRWQKMPKEQQATRIKQIRGKQMVLWAAAVVILALVLAGRAHWLMGVLAGLLALAGRAAQLAQYVPLFKKLFGEPGNAQQASVARSLMSERDAAEILGIELPVSNDEVRLAHKKLMQKIHPDRGGSDGLAKQINQAKEILLKK